MADVLHQSRQSLLDICIALGYARLVCIVQGERLRQSKDVLRLIVLRQRRTHYFTTGLAADIAHGSQHVRGALARDNRSDDPHPVYALDVTDDMMQLQTHVRQRFLHTLDMRCTIIKLPLAHPETRSQRCNLSSKPKACLQQSIGMKSLQPLCIIDIGFLAGHCFGISGIRQNHFDASIFQVSGGLQNFQPHVGFCRTKGLK